MDAHLPAGYELSTDPARLDHERLHRWLSEDSYWASGRSRERQERAVAGSINFGLYDSGSGRQAGYARVVTDHATFGWLCDVYVDPADRGLGLGTALVRAVAADLAARGLPRVALATRDAHGVYEKAGFRPLPVPGEWMTWQPDAPDTPGR
ncbi:GNAT family N-acetyltransferase [Streptomyces catenulae]|uniref:GNAT family N-acetyltransferase n=1 Tax=Streptomyces catenulae TaxID=66875 RepID=A0ABV2Z002_9ACTN|nr:GNAT family N-acetyltransferase [Streptomyces catenulae]